MVAPEDMDTDGPAYVNAGRLWAGGAGAAVVAALAVITLLSGVGRSDARPVDMSRPGRPIPAR